MGGPGISPFGNESQSLSVGGLTVENRADRIAVYGDLDITRDRRGLEAARSLAALLNGVVAALEADDDLPDAVAPPRPADEVDNPFA